MIWVNSQISNKIINFYFYFKKMKFHKSQIFHRYSVTFLTNKPQNVVKKVIVKKKKIE